jgi:hypothetical protein
MPMFMKLWLAHFAITAHGKIDSSCTAFKSDGLASSTFSYYRFYDFRHIGVPNTVSTPNSEIMKTVTDGSWTDDWYVRDYPRKSSGPPIIPVSFIPERVSLSMWDLSGV